MALGLVVGCSSPEKEAQKLIAKHLQETLDDWDSYESVKYSGLDSAFTSIVDNQEWSDIPDKMKRFSERANSYRRLSQSYAALSRKTEESNYDKLAAECSDSIDYYFKKFKEMDSLFIPEFDGWSMIHVYRTNDNMGIKKLKREKFTFDPAITKIKKSIQINEKGLRIDD